MLVALAAALATGCGGGRHAAAPAPERADASGAVSRDRRSPDNSAALIIPGAAHGYACDTHGTVEVRFDPAGSALVTAGGRVLAGPRPRRRADPGARWGGPDRRSGPPTARAGAPAGPYRRRGRQLQRRHRPRGRGGRRHRLRDHRQPPQEGRSPQPMPYGIFRYVTDSPSIADAHDWSIPPRRPVEPLALSAFPPLYSAPP